MESIVWHPQMIRLIREIWMDANVRDMPVTKRILKNADFLPLRIVEKESVARLMDQTSLSDGKRILYLTDQQGDQVKPCPATNPPYLCCRYTVINQVQQCPMDCTYCILQNYLASPLITVNVDLDSIFSEIERLLNKFPNRFFRFGTGELGDSLALDSITQNSLDYIEFFRNQKNCLIELKTKSVNIQNLPEKTPGNTVISWSLNPEIITQKEERYATRLNERLAAAQTCEEKGYLLGFHFDPIIHFKDWESSYKEVIDKLFHAIEGSRIVWISLGTLRFPPALKSTAQKRFPNNHILYEEMIRGLDGKMRYLRPLRIEMYQKIAGWIKEHHPDIFLYFCMESESVWKRVLGNAPSSNAELDYWFARSIHQHFPEIDMIVPKQEYYKESDW